MHHTIGDPTGTGTGGNSIWGQPFADEFNQHLSHEGRGILSMANSGPNTNKSQFFITFRSCKHLDKKHTIFGKLVGGFETLDKMEKVETDAKDRPKDPILIKKVVVYVDPFKEIEKFIESERQKEREGTKSWQSGEKSSLKQFRPGVGSFIDLEKVSSSASASASSSSSSSINSSDGTSLSSSKSSSPVINKKKNKAHAGTFGDFSNW